MLSSFHMTAQKQMFMQSIFTERQIEQRVNHWKSISAKLFFDEELLADWAYQLWSMPLTQNFVFSSAELFSFPFFNTLSNEKKDFSSRLETLKFILEHLIATGLKCISRVDDERCSSQRKSSDSLDAVGCQNAQELVSFLFNQVRELHEPWNQLPHRAQLFGSSNKGKLSVVHTWTCIMPFE